MASKVAAEKLDSIAELFEYESDNYENLVQTCMTTLSSKMYAPPRGREERMRGAYGTFLLSTAVDVLCDVVSRGGVGGHRPRE
jgi:hypothetical protein